MDTGSWWIKDDYIRTTMFFYEGICQDILHVTCKEITVGYAVVGSIDPGILYGLRYIFDSDYLGSLTGHELCDGSGSGIKVVNHFRACKGRILACNAIKLICLLCICLIERLRTDLEPESFHVFVDGIFTLEKNAFLVGN